MRRLRDIVGRLIVYREREGILPEIQCIFRPQSSTGDMMFVVGRPQQLARKHDTSLFMFFVDLSNALDFVD